MTGGEVHTVEDHQKYSQQFSLESGGEEWWIQWTWRYVKFPITLCYVFVYQGGCNMLYPSYTLQGTDISHLGNRKIIFKSTLKEDMLVSRRVYDMACYPNHGQSQESLK